MSATRRASALLAVVLALANVALGVVTLVTHFPRGLIVLGCMLVALAAGWHGALHRGAARVIGFGIALAALAAALILLLSRDPLAMVGLVLTAVAAVAAGRSAFAGHARLADAQAPSRPVLFYNPRSGDGKAERFHLAEEARKRGIEPIELTPDMSLESLVAAALAQGADGLAMAGGDGSQAVVAAAAARAGLPYACIPSGTRNHFALDLGVDRDDPVGALDAFVDGGERVVDLAEVNDRVFVNNVSMGLYAEAVQNEAYRNAKLRTLLDTVPELAGASGDAPPLRWVTADGVTEEGGLAVLVSNNPYRLGRAIGSGTRPRMDTGELGIAVFAPSGELREGLIRMSTTSSLEVDSEAALPAGIDGEAVMLETPVRFTARPAALRVRIARGHPGMSPSAELPENTWSAVSALVKIAFTGSGPGAGPPDG